jgi:hypothetical protein
MESDPFREVSKEILNDISSMDREIKEVNNLFRIIEESKKLTGQGEYIFNLLKGWEEN